MYGSRVGKRAESGAMREAAIRESATREGTDREGPGRGVEIRRGTPPGGRPAGRSPGRPPALLPVLVAALVGLGVAGCDDDDDDMPMGPEEPSGTLVWHQGFDTGTVGWIGAETPGPEGWCGEIARAGPGGGLSASAGTGYALAAFGPCNAYWAENGFPDGSGPYGPYGGYSGAWPQGGFQTELDIYLDPSWPDGTSVLYAVSFMVLDLPFPQNFRYLLIPVGVEGGALTVAGREVTAAGWYTFRHVFRNEGGSLAASFELARDGEVVATMPLPQTAFSEEAVSSFTATNVGTGYAWFVAMGPDLELAIDEHQLWYAE